MLDLICCHGVLMYVPSLDDAVQRLAGMCAAGGLLSVLTRNRAGIAMRAGMQRDWPEAVAGFDSRHYRNLPPGGRPDPPHRPEDPSGAAPA